MKRKNQNTKTDNVKIRKICANSIILGVFLPKLSYKRLNNLDPGNYETISVSYKTIRSSYDNSEKDIKNVYQEIEFLLFQLNQKTNEKLSTFELLAEFEISFKMQEIINEEIFQELKNSCLPLIVNPYMRELIPSIMTRIGLPPIFLPFFEIQETQK
ncbi:MAG: hypothetical protein A2Y33_12100 [Spirochaetes bacterium GWF1_51_8]|nr:MAG: hypothetical protein A2Y33_12100 [Spirochaetes bacterium GWF1_51_8]